MTSLDTVPLGSKIRSRVLMCLLITGYMTLRHLIFIQNYVYENRWVKEQVLNLTQAEKQALSDFLWKNALPENKYYKYDFFFDNCATKIRDVIQEVLGDKLEYRHGYITEQLTFRDLI